MQRDDVLSKPITQHWPRVAWRDFQWVFAGALLLAVLFSLDVQDGFLGLLRIALGLVYVLYVPGYCLAAAIFPTTEDLDTPARGGVSIGLSVALIPLLALLLDQLPWGIRPLPILVGEFGLIAFAATVAIGRRARRPAAPAPVAPAWSLRAWWLAQARGTRGLVIATSVLFFLLALAGAWLVAQPATAAQTTEFYLLGSAGQAQDYPLVPAADGTLSVTIGLVNHEGATQHYRVEVWAVDSQQPTRRVRAAEEGPFVLTAGQHIEQPVRWQLPWPSQDEEVEFLLFTENNPQAYRELRLWLNPAPAAPPGN